MKKIFFIFCFAFLTLNSFSQVVFNRIDTLYNWPWMRNVVIQDNYYYSVGGAYLDNLLGIVTAKSDLNGNLIEAKYYADTITWVHGKENSLKETGTGNYILGGNRGENYFRDNLLIKFNANFDTIFTKKYYPVDDNGYKDVLTYGTNIDVDGGYLLVGTTNIDNNYDSLPEYNVQLIKTDTLGNLLWRKIYGNSTYKHEGYRITKAFDGGYIIGGWSNKNGGDNLIIKTDANGDNPIFRYFGHPTYADGLVMGITPTNDSCYVITASKEITSGGLNRAHIYKLDKNLNLVWDKLYLNMGSVSFFYNALEKENGNIIVHGADKNTLGNKLSAIIELTSEGDSIWGQRLTARDTINTLYSYAENVKLTSDGGLIMTGHIADPTITPDQQMWLVKTDSMGCDGTEWTCDVSYLEELAEKENGNLILYPNPTKSTLFVELKGESEKVKVSTTANIPVIASEAKQSVSNKEIAADKVLAMTLSIEQFNSLTLEKKLKYSSKNPNNKLWGKQEEQEMRELSRKFAYAFPFSVIRGEVDIFSIDPALNASVIARNKVRMTKQSVFDKEITSSYRPRNDVQEITIYDINGRQILKQSCHPERSEGSVYSIDVSSLQKGVYFVQVGENVAKFVKE